MSSKANLENVTQCFLEETRLLINQLNSNPKTLHSILKYISMTRDNSRILGYTGIYKLYKAIEDLYKALCDKKIIFTDNLNELIGICARKLEEGCSIIEKEGNLSDDYDVKPYLLYCDKAVAGEIFESNHLLRLIESKDAKDSKKKTAAREESKSFKQEILNIPSEKINGVLNVHEDMIARTYIINNQIELLKTALTEKNVRDVKELYKLLAGDMQNLQNTLLISHENLMAMVQDESFLKNHQESHGFFVIANDRKYLIPSEFIFDVICESPLNYETVQNQKIVKYVIEKETGDKEEQTEDVPVYALSSLLPGKKTKHLNILDTILIVNYQNQKIGIIVEAVQKFASVIKKNMPAAFENFPALKGVAFDEKYDMIPILHVPDIMKRFRSLRGYDVKKFEAITKKHINKILIVDDSETTRQIERTILLANNFIVDEAIDGIDAMDKIKKKQFDLILCDDEMPRMNGEILLDNIRRMDNYTSVPVVAMADKPLAKADAFVSKSDFTRDNLVSTLKRMLNDE